MKLNMPNSFPNNFISVVFNLSSMGFLIFINYYICCSYNCLNFVLKIVQSLVKKFISHLHMVQILHTSLCKSVTFLNL
jgi:hypothetical protein